ncbi:MAG: MFS transporter [Acidimicrobiales bacterium]
MTRFRGAVGDTFRSLKVRNYRLFFFGQLTSQAGTWMQSVALIWVVLRLTDSGVALGLVTAAQFLPVLVLGAWGGVLADRVDRHRFMITTQVAFTVVAGTIATLMVLDRLTMPFIYGLSMLYGIFTAVDNPTRKSMVVDLVEMDDIPNAVALNSAMMTGSRVVGPSIAGLLITTVGVEWCFIVNTISYFAVIGALLLMRRSEMREAPRTPRGKGQLVEGLRYVGSEPELRNAIILLTVVGTLAFEYQVTLPLLAERTLDAGAGGFTLLYSAMSLGSVVGALTMARRRSVDISFLVKGAWGLAAAMTVLSIAPTLWLAAIAVMPVGACTIYMVSGANSLIQLKANPRMRGRALALTTVVFIGSTPIGGPIAGYVSEHLGAPAGLMMGAISTAAVAFWVGRHRYDEQPLPAESPVDSATVELTKA